MSYPQQPDPTGQQQPPESKRPKRKASAVNVVALIALVAALCVLGVALVTSVGDDAPVDPTSADRSFSAEVMCEEFIGKRLKSPGSAKYTHQDSRKNGAQYVVVGYVDSQNSFGALVRTTYVCTVTDQGDDTWRLDDLRLE